MSMQQGPALWPKGVIVPLATLITETEQLDRHAFEELLSLQLDNGVDALFVLGSVGEGPMLADSVRLDVVRAAVGFANGRAPVFAGVMDNSVALVLERIKRIAEAGAQAAVTTLPYYGWYNNEESAREFFFSIADASPIPIIAYNLPRVTGVSLSYEVLRDMAQHPNICSVKDTRADLESMRAAAAMPERKGRMSYVAGNSAFAGELMACGGDGVVSVLGNFFPELLAALYKAHQANDAPRVADISAILAGLSKVLSLPTTPGGVKCALELRNIGTSRTIRPWPKVLPEHKAQIVQLIDTAKAAFNVLSN